MTKKTNIEKLKNLAKQYGCEDNPLFLTTLDQYVVQQRVIESIRDALDASEVAVSKEYVKGRENLYAHPLIKELPKHSDSANRTADMLLKIIQTVGNIKDKSDSFDGFLADRDEM